MKKVLEMIFKTGTGKSYKLTLDDPREDITPTDVQTAMELIIANDPFDIEGGLTEIGEANIIITQSDPLVLA